MLKLLPPMLIVNPNVGVKGRYRNRSDMVTLDTPACAIDQYREQRGVS
jgi:hypothetical protein